MADLPRKELLDHAHATLEMLHAQGKEADVYFKTTCPNCGERLTFTTPNTLFEQAACHVCGTEFPVHQGGYLLAISLNGQKEELN